MLCRADELHLPSPADPPTGCWCFRPGWPGRAYPLVEALDIASDVVFDLDVSSANRPDALCMAGVARDLAAALGEPWGSRPSAQLAPVAVELGPATVVVDGGRPVSPVHRHDPEGVPTGPSPAWMARRLTLAGMRPINAVVDVSNYVMLDLGQPNHAYDLDRLAGGGSSSGEANPGETLVTLDGVERDAAGRGLRHLRRRGPAGRRRRDHGRRQRRDRAVEPGRCCSRRPGSRPWRSPARESALVCTQRPGSASSGVSTPRSPSRRSTASWRRCLAGMERRGRSGADRRWTSTIASTCRRGPVGRAAHGPGQRHFSARELDRRHGGGSSANRSASQFSRIGSRGVLGSRCPTWRLECSREIDVVEEVARMWGYRRIERTIPSRRQRSAVRAHQPPARAASGAGRVRRGRLRRGLDHDVPRPRRSRKSRARSGGGRGGEPVRPLGVDPAHVSRARPAEGGQFNVDRQIEQMALFEIGRVFHLPSRAGCSCPTRRS